MGCLDVLSLPRQKRRNHLRSAFPRWYDQAIKLCCFATDESEPGLAESTFYPGMQYIIGSWYRKEELAKRSCIFHTSAAIATMFSGYLMAGVYKLDGRAGFKGWQWLFIIDGIISVPIAILGFFALPDLPEISKPFYLTKEEVAFAQKRMQLEGRQKRQPYTRAKFRKIFTSWHIYALVALYVFFNNGNSASQPVFQQFLKASKHPKYTVSEINTVCHYIICRRDKLTCF
jgi:ACS family pantothenate transporter-like MFS transporter